MMRSVGPSFTWRPLTMRDVALPVIVASVCVLIQRVIQVRLGLNFDDEGMLWYGVQRTLVGEMPVRDFQAYEPGRYWVLAAWARLLGSDGLVMLRLGLAAVQWLTLVVTLLALSRVVANRWLLAAFGVLLSLWMAPLHKMFDVSAAFGTTCFLAWLAGGEEVCTARCVGAGFFAGALWLVGLNHALYGSVSGFLLVAALAFRDHDPMRSRAGELATCIALYALGAALALGVIALSLALIPGYLPLYIQNAILRLFEAGSTNLTLPIPWPWRAAPQAGYGMGGAALGWAYALFPVMLIVVIGMLAYPATRAALMRCPLLLAAIATAATWAHHAFARADLPHLAQGGGPLVLVILCLPYAFENGVRRRRVMAICWPVIGLLTICLMPTINPAVRAAETGVPREWVNVSGEALYASRANADIYRACSALLGKLPPGESTAFLPTYPGVYAALHVRCPIWESYALFPSSDQHQRETIQSLQASHTTQIVYWPAQVDDREDLSFPRTHALVWEYIQAHYHLMCTLEGTGGAQLYRARDSHEAVRGFSSGIARSLRRRATGLPLKGH